MDNVQDIMRKSLFILFLVYCTFCAISYGEEIPTNERPMYGNIPMTDEEKKCNENFINEAIQKAGSREAAAQSAIKLAWQYFYNNDPRTAMKRFNQAWLLDPNNAEVFYGFGILTSLQGKADEAISLYKKALELNPNHPMALANLARSYRDKAYALYCKKELEYPDDEVKRILGEALALYEKASQAATTGSDLRLTDLDSDLRYIYYQWAVALEFNGEYAKAWEKIKLSRKHGGEKLIEPGFIEELSHFMPEPKD